MNCTAVCRPCRQSAPNFVPVVKLPNDYGKHPLKSRAFLSVALLLLAGLALLAAGSVFARNDFLTRGLPPGLPEPINYGGPQLAINVYLENLNSADLEETLSQIKATGITTIKQPFYFSEGFDWQASDRIVAAASNQGLELIPLLDGDPANRFAPPNDPLNVLCLGWGICGALRR